MKLPQSISWKVYLVVTVVVKICYAFYLSFLLRCADPQLSPGSFAVKSGDTFSYTEAMENYIKYGRYYFYNGEEQVLAGRLPHYSVPYLFFRQIFSEAASYDLLAMLQLILECLAIVCLVATTNDLIRHRLAGPIVWLLTLFSSNWTLFSLYASPESFSCSFLVFSIFFYCRYHQFHKNTHLLLCGLCLAILATLKSYLIVGFIFLGISFLKQEGFDPLNVNTWKAVVGKTILVSIPLVLLLAPWVWRNYLIYHRFIPLQINTTAGYNYTKSDFAFRQFVGAWGGDIIYWERTSAGCYFIPDPKVDCIFQMPNHAFTDEYGEKEVAQVRNDFVELQKQYTEELDSTTASAFSKLTESYRKEKPFQYYLMSPVRLLVRFVNHSGSYYLPVHSGNPCYAPAQLIFKVVQSLIYWISITLGLTGLIVLSYKRKDAFILSFNVFIIILFPFVFRIVEWRYLRTIEPVLYIGVAYMIVAGLKLISSKIRV